ncbi:MAG: THUMP domain-containing protein [Candidatus Poseidoniia archaeon]|nr:THUMP domain-containing protein [Candidatus Poseidoniia archaeon]
MNNYLSSSIPKRSLRKTGRKIVLEQIEKNNILGKYEIFDKYLYLTTVDPISKNTKEEYKLCIAKLCNAKEEIIYKKIKDVIPAMKKYNTFAINVERRGDHKFTSTELARELAGSVFDVFPEINVDLGKPELTVHVKVINNKCLLYTEEK